MVYNIYSLLIGSLIVGTFLVSDSVVEKNSEKKLIEEVAEIASGSDSLPRMKME